MEEEHLQTKQQQQEQNEVIPSKGLPFLLKATALLLIVYGLIGLTYYLFTTIYSIGNSEFLKELQYNDYREKYLFIPLVIEILVHLAAILAGFLIIFRKKQGQYYFYFAFIFSMTYSFFFLGWFNTSEIIIGSILMIIIFIYRKKI